MDLAILVYVISLLHGIGGFFTAAAIISGIFFVFFSMWKFAETDHQSYYSERKNAERAANGVMCWKWMKVFATTGIISAWVLILLPTEKTAYTMVGAYAAQRVAENPKVQELSGKVLKVIENKLDKYVEEAEQKVVDEVEKKTK